MIVKSTGGFQGFFGLHAYYDDDQTIISVDASGWAGKNTDLAKYIGWRIKKVNRQTIRSSADMDTVKASMKKVTS